MSDAENSADLGNDLDATRAQFELCEATLAAVNEGAVDAEQARAAWARAAVALIKVHGEAYEACCKAADQDVAQANSNLDDLHLANKLVSVLQKATLENPDAPDLRAQWDEGARLLEQAGRGEKGNVFHTPRHPKYSPPSPFPLGMGDLYGMEDALEQAVDDCHNSLPQGRLAKVRRAANLLPMLGNFKPDELRYMTRKLLDTLQAVVLAHPEEGTVRHQWAAGVCALVKVYHAEWHTQEAYARAATLEPVVMAFQDDPDLRAIWHKALSAVIGPRTRDLGTRSGDMVCYFPTARAALETLVQEGKKDPGNKTLRDEWAWQVASLSCSHMAQDDPCLMVPFMETLDTACEAHKDEPILREYWKEAAPYVVKCLRERGALESAHKLLNTFEPFVRAKTADYGPDLRNMWAYELKGLRDAFQNEGKDAEYQVLKNSLAQMAHDYPAEERIAATGTTRMWYNEWSD